MNAEATIHCDEPRDEMIGGKIVLMSPRPTINHLIISDNICKLFSIYVDSKTDSKCKVFSDGADLFLTKTNRFIPDGMVVCDPNKVKYDGIHGAPDLVVEVLSPSTMKRDRTEKKDVYEKCGVKEYWIVNPAGKSIEQYILENGRFTLNEVYVVYEDYMIESWSEEDKAAIVTEFKCSLSDELVLRLEDIFARVE